MPTPKSKRTIVLQSSNHDSESGSTTEEFSLGASSVVGKTSKIIIVTNTNDSGYSSLTSGASSVVEGMRPDRLIGTLGGNDTISYVMAEATRPDRLIGTLGGNDSFGSDGADTLRASYFGGNIALPPLLDESTSLLQYDRIKVKKLPYASESSSLGDAVANSTKVTLKNLIIANGTGGSQDESTESAGQATLYGGMGEDSYTLFGSYSEASPETGKKLKQLRPLGQQLYPSPTEESNEDGTGKSQDEPTEYFNGSNGVLTVAASTFSRAGKPDILTGGVYSEPSPDSIINTGNGDDSLIGGYSELRPIFEIITLPPPRPPRPSPAFTDAIDKLFDFNGFPGLSAIQRSQEVASEFSGASSSDGAWALGSTFELNSGDIFSSQI